MAVPIMSILSAGAVPRASCLLVLCCGSWNHAYSRWAPEMLSSHIERPHQDTKVTLLKKMQRIKTPGNYTLWQSSSREFGWGCWNQFPAQLTALPCEVYRTIPTTASVRCGHCDCLLSVGCGEFFRRRHFHGSLSVNTGRASVQLARWPILVSP